MSPNGASGKGPQKQSKDQGDSKPPKSQDKPKAPFNPVSAGLQVALIAVLALGGCWWVFWKVTVGPGETLFVSRAFGANNPDANRYRVIPSDGISTKDGKKLTSVKGVREQAYGEGYYFFNPFIYKTEVLRDALVEIGPAEVGVVTSLAGKQLEGEGQFLVDEPGYKGILRRVLTPGRYRINPRAYRVEKVPATIIEPGYVGVLTYQTGKAIDAERTKKEGPDALAEAGEMGVQREVLQPGIYFLNPREYKVGVVEIGYREYSIRDIRFTSDDGQTITCDVTVIWGIHPENAPHIVKHIGRTDAEIKRKVLDQVVQSASRIIGGKYDAARLVSGSGRTEFAEAFKAELVAECKGNKIEILNGLIRKIEIPQKIRKHIQEREIQAERKLTLEDQMKTQKVRNELQEQQSQVEAKIRVTRAETAKQVAKTKDGGVAAAAKRREEGEREAATIRQQGLREAARIGAEAQVKIAELLRQVAIEEAAATEIIGKAEAKRTELTKAAEADRFTQIVAAFGSADAFTRYTFAQNLPEGFQVTLRYAGPGTFWTDMPKEFGALERAASLKLLEREQPRPRR